MELFADLVNSTWNAIGMESTFELFVYQVLCVFFSFNGKQIIRTHDVHERTESINHTNRRIHWFGFALYEIDE